jgi:hypothetical protein
MGGSTLKRYLGAVALCATVTMSACGAGGGSASSPPLPSGVSPVTGGMSSSGTTSAATTKATISLLFPLATASALTKARTPQFVAATTKTLYFSLEDSPGHGNTAFSYTFSVDSTHCTASIDGASESCSYSASVPIGTEAFSLLTTDANGVPLGYDPYVNGTVKSDGSGLNASVFAISPIVAKAVSTYAFQAYGEYPQPPPPLPGITTIVYDADGNQLGGSPTSNSPFGDTYGSYTISQDVNDFSVEYLQEQFAATPSPAEQTEKLTEPSRSPVVVELPPNSTAAFITNVTTRTPVTSFTQTEFPQLTAPVSVPASSTSFTLRCQFPNGSPTSDPCPGSISVAIPIH